VRIDSPGGEQVASDEIWRQMNLLAREAAGVFDVGLAASGGLLHRHDGRPIVAYPETDRVHRVVFGKPNLHGFTTSSASPRIRSNAGSTPASIPTTPR